LGFSLAVLPAIAFSADDVLQWLERMSAAMSQMNYQGTFVYVQGDEVETVRITHVVDANGSRERLVSVSGAPREVVRDAEGVRWISGDEGTVLANSASNRTFFPELPLGNPEQASESYRFELEDSQRIAGHSGQRLEIIPRDQFRYGYRLWLETRSGLPLQWELTGTHGETLAKLMFTELKMGSEVDPAELHSAGRAESPEERKSDLVAEEKTSGSDSLWQAAELPPGFRLASRRQQPVEHGKAFEHLVYSDGIAAVSVYVESADDEGSQVEMGLSKLGTTHAFSHEVDGQIITALGDVPAATVKLIGASVKAPVR
jgi:sigma-E factor negative regulatory protein RseB